MATGEFHPKLGRIRSKSSTKNQRYLNRVIKTMRQAAHSSPKSGR
jgi:hypothetical protein